VDGVLRAAQARFVIAEVPAMFPNASRRAYRPELVGLRHHDFG